MVLVKINLLYHMIHIWFMLRAKKKKNVFLIFYPLTFCRNIYNMKEIEAKAEQTKALKAIS